MDLTENAMWALVEEAVIQDRGEDEEDVLAQMVRSYLARRGLADTLHAFDAEHDTRHTPRRHQCIRHNGTSASASLAEAAATAASTTEAEEETSPGLQYHHHDSAHEMDRRKAAQLLCLQQHYEAAASLMQADSLTRIRLLCIQAECFADTAEAVFYLASTVAPLVPFCAQPALGHEVYTTALSNVLHPKRKAMRVDAEALAKEVNEELCGGGYPSSLDVLFNWAYWQEAFV